MQINLTGHHVEITDSLRNYVDTKFSKLERHFDHISNVHVILNVEKLNQKAEATVHLSGAEVSSRGHRAAGCSEGDESLSSPQIESLS